MTAVILPDDLDERERAFVGAFEREGVPILSVARLPGTSPGSTSVRLDLAARHGASTHAARLRRHARSSDYRPWFSFVGASSVAVVAGDGGREDGPFAARLLASREFDTTNRLANGDLLRAASVVERDPHLLGRVDEVRTPPRDDEGVLAYYLFERLALLEDPPGDSFHSFSFTVSAAVVDLEGGAPLDWVLRRHAGWRE